MTVKYRSTASTLFTLCLVLFVSASAVARDLPSGKAKREGMSAQRLDRITQHMEAAVEAGTMAGGLGMISRNGRIVYQETYGMSDREAGTPMQEDTIFRIYSMSKPITGVALMMLYEEGRFFLNDPVAKYIPELANLRLAVSTADGETSAVSDGTNSSSEGSGDESAFGETREPTRQPTIRDLLRHTAGMTYGIFGDTEVDRQYRQAELFAQKDLAGFVKVLGQQPLQYEPGSRWHYSVAVDVQGRLVEVLSGMRFSDFLQQRIFDALDMKDTSFILPEEKLDRLAQLYVPEGTKLERDSVWQRSASQKLEVADPQISEGFIEGGTFESGGGGLLSTAADYMRFSLMMLNGGELNGVRLLSPKSVELMTRNQTGELRVGRLPEGIGFGLGFAVVLDTGLTGELGSDGEYSWGGAAGTRFWIDPLEKMVGVFMVQSIPHQTTLAQEFRVMSYQAITESQRKR
jgi:CubicO group peptidase (beta-lactamase class C family)